MLFNTKDSSTIFGALVQSRQNNSDVGAYKQAINDINIQGVDTDWFIKDLDISNYTTMSDTVKGKLVEIQDELKKTGGTGKDAIFKINQAMEETSSTSTKLGGAIKNIGKSILNGLVSSAVLTGISLLVSYVSDAIDKLVMTREEAEKLANTFSSSYSSLMNEQGNAIKELSAIEKEYDELSKGVNAFGENVSLTEEEFKRYNQITGIIAENMPNLVVGYTKQGDAIIRLRDNVKSLTEEYERNQKVAAQDLYQKKDEDGDRVVEGAFRKAEDDFAMYTAGDNSSYDIEYQLKSLETLSRWSLGEILEKDLNSYQQELLEELGVSNKTTAEEFKSIHIEIEKQYEELKSTLEADAQRIGEAGLTYAKGYLGYYQKLSSEQQTIFDGIMNSLSTSTINLYNLWNEDEMKKYVQSVMDVVGKLSSKDIEQIQIGLDISTKWNNGELSYDELKAKLEEFDKILNTLFPNNREIITGIKFVFNIPDLEELEKERDVAINRRTKIIKNTRSDEKSYIDNQLEELEKGGNVNLKLRPEIDTKYLKDKGWKDIEDGIATVYTSTFSNEDETKFINFTPIIVDPKTGEFKGVLSPEELQEYAEGVIAGTKTDDLNLQIGTEFDTVEEADNAAERIHQLHERKSQLPSSNYLLEDNGMQPQDQFGSPAWLEANKPTQAPFRDIQPQVLTEEEIKKGEEAYAKFYDTLSTEEREFLDSLGEDKLEITADYTSVEEFKKWWDEIRKDNLMDVEIETKSSKGVADLKAMDDAFGDDLATAYNATKTQGGKATATEIEAVNTAFGGTTFDAKEGEDVNLLSSAIENYNDALVENAGDANAAQTATNQLATAYVDQSGVLDTLIDDLDHVTDAEKEYYIQQLKDQGITNAQEVVESRLTKQYQKHSKALKDLSKYVTQNNKAFKEAVKQKDEDSSTISDMTDKVQNLLKVYNSEGEEITELTPDIDPSFIIENAETIERAIAGDIDAITELRIAAAQKIYTDVELFDDAFWADCQAVAVEIAQLDSSSFDINGYMNNSDIIAKLNQINAKCNETGQNFADVLHYITGGAVDAEYEWEEKKVADYNGMASEAVAHITNTTIKVLKGIKYKWNGSSTGVGGKYNGGGGSSTGGNGGGSNGGGGTDNSTNNDKASEDADETFDWIEVRIQRLEEEIARLDKVAGNVYDKWADRNKSVSSKIGELTKEIEAQKIALKEYGDYANALQINGGKELDWHDYGDDETTAYESEQYKYDKKQYDKAKELWESKGKEYQTKIQNGQWTGDDIEKLGNKYLIDILNEYRTWWEKSIAAKDAIKDLEIQQHDMYKQLYENLIKEYDDVTTDLSNQMEILEKRIERTQEHGYFVDASYYKELKELQNKKITNQTNELKKATDAVNNFVKAGVTSGEAYEAAKQQLQDLNIGLEDMLTEMVKLENEERQLKWDKFDWLEERLADIIAEAEWLNELLEGEDNYDDKGYLTNRGYARAALIGAELEANKAKLERVKAEIAKNEEDLKKDPLNKDLIEHNEQLIQIERDITTEMKNQLKAENDLVKNGISKHIEALSELIEKYKESMSEAKDLYEYQKNVANQTKNIANLEKQLAAYSGDDSEETRKKRQELQKQLDDAQQQLQETEWDRYISETGQMLDDLKNDYEEYLNNQADKIVECFNTLTNDVNANKKAVQDGFTEIKNEYGIEALEYFDDFGNSQENLYSDFTSVDFSGKLSSIHDIIDDFKKSMEEATKPENNGIRALIEKLSKDIITLENGQFSLQKTEAVKEEDKKKEEGLGTKLNNLSNEIQNPGQWKQDTSTGKWWYKHDDGTYTRDDWEKIGDKWYYFDNEGWMASDEYRQGYYLAPDGSWSKEYSGGTWHEDPDYPGWWWYQDGDWYPKNGWYKIDGDWYYFDDHGWMAKDAVIGGYTIGSDGKWLGYATGTKKVPNDQLAWTQENASELIYRTSDGAMLTPLNRGDMVFTHDMSQRLWEIASGNMPVAATVVLPNVAGANTRTITTNNSISIELPNVQNYDDFKRELKSDTEFEKFMQEVTIGQVMGNNKLNKHKF